MFGTLAALAGLWTALGAQPPSDAAPRAERLPNGVTWVWKRDASLAKARVSVAFRAKSDALAPQGVARWFFQSLPYGSDSFGALNLNKEAELRARLLEQSRLATGEDPKLSEAALRRARNLQREAATSVLPHETAQLYGLIGSEQPEVEYAAEGVLLRGSVPAERLAAWLELTALNLSRPAFRCSDRQVDQMTQAIAAYRRQPGAAWADSCRAALLGPARDGLKYCRLPDNSLGLPPLSSVKYWHENWFAPQRLLVIVETPQPYDSARRWMERSFGRLSAGNPASAEEGPKINLAPLPRLPKSIACGTQPAEALILPWLPVGHPDFAAAHWLRYRLTNDIGTGAFDRLRLNGLADTVEWAFIHDAQRTWLLVRFAAPPNSKLGKTFRQAAERRLDSLLNAPMERADIVRWQRLTKHEQRIQRNRPFALAREIAQRWQRGDSLKQFDLENESWKKVRLDSLPSHLQRNWGSEARKWIQLRPEKPGKPQAWREPLAVGTRDSVSEWGQNFATRWGPRQRPDTISFQRSCTTLNLGMRQKLYHLHAKDTTHFDLLIQYHLGSYRLLSLPQLCEFLNYVGTYKKKAEEVQDSLERYGTRYRFAAVGDRMELRITGRPEGLAPTLQLMQELLAYPDRDYATLDRVIRRESHARLLAGKQPRELGDALGEYLIHKSYSPYVRRLSSPEMKTMLEPARLRDSLRRLIQLPITVHYRGPQALETVHGALTKEYQLPKRARRPRRPMIKKIAYYRKPEVLIFNMPGASETHLTAYVPGNRLPLDSIPHARTLTALLGGAEGSLLEEELLVRRRVAYEFEAGLASRELLGYRAVFRATVVCPPEKTEEAMRSLRLLIREPSFAGGAARRTSRQLAADYAWQRPDDARLTEWIDSLSIDSCAADPSAAHYDSLQTMTQAKIDGFFNHHLKKRPLSFAIVADKKKLDLEKLARYGELRFVPLDEFWKP